MTSKLTRVNLLMIILYLTIKDSIAIGAAGADDEVSESNEKTNDNINDNANDVNDDSDSPKDLDIIETEQGKKSLELFYRRKGTNDMIYNNAAALEALGNGDSPEREEDRSSIKLTLYPFAVSIQNKGLHYATASLLSYKWLISCAADFYNVRESIRMLRARLGSIDCKRGGTIKRIREIFIHPEYKVNIPNFDLALLELSTAVPYGDDIRPIPLSPVEDSGDLAGSFLSTYWARLFNKGTPVNETAAERVKEGRLRVSKKTTRPFVHCYEILSRYNATLETTSVCYHPFVNFHSPCMPDSGAPIVVKNELWGVTSSFCPEDCGVNNLPPTFATRLTAPIIRSWITETMANSD